MVTTSVAQEIGGVSSSDEERRSYAQHVKPIWVKLLDALGMNVQSTHCSSAELYSEVSEAQLDHCVESIRSVVETVHSSKLFWIYALNLGRRAMPL